MEIFISAPIWSTHAALKAVCADMARTIAREAHPASPGITIAIIDNNHTPANPLENLYCFGEGTPELAKALAMRTEIFNSINCASSEDAYQKTAEKVVYLVYEKFGIPIWDALKKYRQAGPESEVSKIVDAVNRFHFQF